MIYFVFPGINNMNSIKYQTISTNDKEAEDEFNFNLQKVLPPHIQSSHLKERIHFKYFYNTKYFNQEGRLG